jgi:ferredoxin
MSRWTISAGKNMCTCSAMCAALAPGRFVPDQQQRSGPAEAGIDPDELVRDAAACCPSQAISLIDADTGQPVDLDQSMARPPASRQAGVQKARVCLQRAQAGQMRMGPVQPIPVRAHGPEVPMSPVPTNDRGLSAATSL